MGLLDWEEEQEAKLKVENRHKAEARANRLLKKKKIRRGIKKKHKQKIPKMTYKQYMGSAYWKKRKLLYWSKNGKLCAICESKFGVTLHHKKYDNALNGKEPDDFFVALCPKHHHEFHQNHELAKDMMQSTDLYVETMKQVIHSNIDDLSWI
jgi:hypothetical protein